ncbi:MAG: MBL fold hydrolase [Candidatus Altiarchaeales archaeon WOR_SM1_86-2]|nr:MAG: MBL fold hydrolase [Candidatus Altiarchaeales archaeon WOR_SM1_86-2]
MNLKILYDNKAREGFKSAWGFSCLIEAEEKILFDTGWDGNLLHHNMRKLNVDPKNIGKIVISHDHWDHAGGVSYILNETDDPEVFVPRSFSGRLKKEIASRARLREVSGEERISNNVFTTGELGTSIKEHSVFIETDKGFVVITGCSHPGLHNILNFVKNYGKIYWVIGGFHGFSYLEYLKHIPLLSPCHCTANMEKIKSLYPDAYRECCAGSEFEI